MPTYEYACTSCGEHIEVVQSFRDAPLTVCPACAGPLRKVFGSIGIVFKGSGFYKTDSRSASGPAKDGRLAGHPGQGRPFLGQVPRGISGAVRHLHGQLQRKRVVEDRAASPPRRALPSRP